MELNEYQKKALETAVYAEKYKILYPALGLSGEAGEVNDKVKKVLRDNNGEFSDKKRTEIMLELGDVMWYIAVLANDLGFALEEVCEANNIKLASRAQRGMLGGSGDNR